jgi:hypothetical protein
MVADSVAIRSGWGTPGRPAYERGPLDFRCCAGSCNIASSQIRSAVSLGRILLGLAHRGDSNSALCESRATSKVIGGDEGAGTKGGSALGERERVLPPLTVRALDSLNTESATLNSPCLLQLNPAPSNSPRSISSASDLQIGH